MGNKRMFIIPGGMIECDLANMVAMPALADADNRETVSRWVKSPVYYVLIENEEGPVLFDTGCHPKAMTDRWDMGNRKRDCRITFRTAYNYIKNMINLQSLD